MTCTRKKTEPAVLYRKRGNSLCGPVSPCGDGDCACLCNNPYLVIKLDEMRVKHIHSKVFRRAELPELSAIVRDVKVYVILFPFANASAKTIKRPTPYAFGFPAHPARPRFSLITRWAFSFCVRRRGRTTGRDVSTGTSDVSFLAVPSAQCWNPAV